MKVSISKGNSKMGDIKSVSLPAILTCRECGCNKKCYARRIERRRKNVHAAYMNNLEILNTNPELYWREVEATIMMSRFFRYHVSGDIPNAEYFQKMVEIAERQKHCEMLCFTKKFDIVNNFLYGGGVIPDNLHILFSAWVGLKMDNPFSLPEAHVRFKDGTTTASEGAIHCGGNCTNCAITDSGCWTLKKGEQLVLDEH